MSVPEQLGVEPRRSFHEQTGPAAALLEEERVRPDHPVVGSDFGEPAAAATMEHDTVKIFVLARLREIEAVQPERAAHLPAVQEQPAAKRPIRYLRGLRGEAPVVAF